MTHRRKMSSPVSSRKIQLWNCRLRWKIRCKKLYSKNHRVHRLALRRHCQFPLCSFRQGHPTCRFKPWRKGEGRTARKRRLIISQNHPPITSRRSTSRSTRQLGCAGKRSGRTQTPSSWKKSDRLLFPCRRRTRTCSLLTSEDWI